MKVSIVLATFNNSVQFKRLMGQIVNLTDFYDYEREVIIVDNTEDELERNKISEIVDEFIPLIDIEFIRNDFNKMLANATNIAIDHAESDYMVYLCSSHTYLYHKDWLKHLIDNMEIVKKEPYAMGGCRASWPNSFEDKRLHTHIQGGVFIAPTKIMKEYKYDEVKYPHSFCDVDICERFLKDGYKLRSIPKVFSIMGNIPKSHHESWKKTNKFYIAHSHSIPNFA